MVIPWHYMTVVHQAFLYIGMIIVWYTMESLFQSNMVCHGFHSISWYAIMVYLFNKNHGIYHGIYDGIFSFHFGIFLRVTPTHSSHVRFYFYI